MRRIIIFSYTEPGGQLNHRIARCLTEGGDVALSYLYGRDFTSTAAALESEWRCTSAFVFIGAVGIAVRHIAPLLQDKLQDPAVLVIDEAGQFAIPVLSGHVGGGVALAREVARFLGAQAVVTTATDVQERFAVDVFAADNHLRLPDSAAVREVSAAVLQDRKIVLRTQIPLEGEAFPGVTAARATAGNGGAARAAADVAVGYGDGRTACVLAHRSYIVGVGCKKGKSGEELYTFLAHTCEQNGVALHKIAAVASIDGKREERGIWELARRLGASYEVFSAEELSKVEGKVNGSAFVERTVGVDNVCERSALCLAGRWAAARGKGGESGGASEYDGGGREEGGAYRLAVEKQAQDGMTLALARFEPSVYRWRAL